MRVNTNKTSSSNVYIDGFTSYPYINSQRLPIYTTTAVFAILSVPINVTRWRIRTKRGNIT